MKIVYFYGIFLLLFLGVTAPSTLHSMAPKVKNGCYYYPYEDENCQRMDRKQCLLYVWKKICSLCVSADRSSTEKIDVQAVLNPIQSVPCARCVEPTITWVGHATFLVQMNGFNILTDPVFGDTEVGPITWEKRIMKPGIDIKALPPIHAIGISHNHLDHTDTSSLTYIAQKYAPIVFVPLGNKELLESMGFTRVVEHNWWDSQKLTHDGREITFTCLPAYHWSRRSLFDYNKSLWSSWMLSTEDRNIYFAGDSAYGPHFTEIADAYKTIDVALMPIAPTGEKENPCKQSHVDAPEAVQAFIDLRARTFIPMHYGTFSSSKTKLTYPLQRLRSTWQENACELKDKNLIVAQCGKPYTEL